MTEQSKLPVNYLDRADLKLIHSIVSKSWQEDGEPIPPFSTAVESNLESLIKTPKSNYFDVEQYPTIESKAAIIFYTLNKKHLFLNGNKRLSVACLSIFLFINGKQLNVESNEMTEKALELAKTNHTHDFKAVMRDLETWIRDRLDDFDVSSLE
ncbi:MAG: type II toxin-antitoxin system death-on-curing family toxin [Candidatus Pacebacteria bacterium]|nr:type II toxin-antitoxin system death-on-curing family toxin [Candidatus Paceibacterota bacterium]